VTDEPALRASDADRDRVAAVLAEAYASGRLTSLEHADRLEATYRARTMADLVPLTADLPAVQTSAAAPAQVEHQTVKSVFSKIVRRGRWIASRHTHLSATYGALVVDLSEAVLPGREITVSVSAFASKVIVRVPKDAQVIDEAGAMFAKRQISGGSSPSADGPVIRVTGKVTLGKLVVARKVHDWNLAHDA
jgi:hypothetical protein